MSNHQDQAEEIGHSLNKKEIEELKTISRELDNDITDGPIANNEMIMHPLLGVGLVGAFLAHAAIILSLPPVIRGKGAPFLPTTSAKIDTMFTQLRKHPVISQKLSRKEDVRFLDLGSGDGRVVFRAAREKMFSRSTGVEINPVLHAWALGRRMVQGSRYWATTDFALQDLWSVDLSKTDVVAVYGLHPIMGELGKKMRKEMKDGSVVVSNVFTIPGWKPGGASSNGVHLYTIPECFRQNNIHTNKPVI